mgnify:FL=1
MIRNAAQEDFQQILRIYEYARNFMKQTGNPTQWGDHSPAVDVLRKDMEKGQLYVVEEDGQVCGVFAFIIEKDPTYERIENGAWKSDTEYGTIHRVATDGTKHGVFHQIVSFCEKKKNHLRIDTHEKNKIMRHLIQKNGFLECGIIYVADGSPRIAYEKAGTIRTEISVT